MKSMFGRLFSRSAAKVAAIAMSAAITGEGAAQLLLAQGFSTAAFGVRVVVGLVLFIGLSATGFAVSGQDTVIFTTAVFATLLLFGTMLSEVLARVVSPEVGCLVQVMACTAACAWTWRVFRPRPELQRLATALATVAGSLLTIWFFYRIGWITAAIALGGSTVMAVVLAAGFTTIRIALSGSDGVSAVARTAVDELTRMQAAGILVIAAIIALPFFPLLLDDSERLEYRVQFLINWSLGGSGFLISVLTILAACATVTGDIDSSRIHMTLVKPLARWQYLLGKWVGISLVALLLVLVSGAVTYTMARWLAVSSSADEVARAEVRSHVLTARSAVRPRHHSGDDFDRQIAAEIQRRERENPDAFAKNRDRTITNIRNAAISDWQSLSPGERSSFMFEGLAKAKQSGEALQLRIKPQAYTTMLSQPDIRFSLWLNGRPFPVVDGRHTPYTFTTGMFHTIDLPVSAVNDGGRLEVTIAHNSFIPQGMNFSPSFVMATGSGMEMLYPDGSFEANFTRGLGIMWVKLVVLASAALAAASGLGFPVAVLAGFMVYATAAAKVFVGDALDAYTGLDLQGASLADMADLRTTIIAEKAAKFEVWEMIKSVMAIVGELFVAFVPPFAKYDFVPTLSSGRMLTPSFSIGCLLELGVLYGVLFAILGWGLLARRDLVKNAG